MEKMHPVYRYHLSEIEAVVRLVSRALLAEGIKAPEDRDPGKAWLSPVGQALGRIRFEFHRVREEVLYLNDRDFEMVKRLVGFVKTNPELLNQ